MKKIWYNGVILEFHAIQKNSSIFYSESSWDKILDCVENYLIIFKTLPLHVHLTFYVGGISMTVYICNIEFDSKNKLVKIYFE